MKWRRIVVIQENKVDIVAAGRERKKSFLRLILHWILGLILWLIVLAPGVMLIAYGGNGIMHKRLIFSRFRSTTRNISYGDDAVGWGWLFVSAGFWALGKFIALKTERSEFNFIGWVLAIVAGGIGVWVLLRRFL